MRKIRNKGGFTMVELVMVIIIIAVIAGGVISANRAIENSKAVQQIQNIKILHSAAVQWYGDKMTYAGISVAALKTDGYLKNNFDSTKANQFGGDLTVNVDSSDTEKYEFSLTKVSNSTRQKLENGLLNSTDNFTYDANTQTWTATF
ncbi:MAG: prepilin-type N-terminal cleavage/methylation domain-containing protein [Candidatus Omnitrophica bacterium]|nr:prepilin-type N-terminal cleavage/methylation domain-containing protein [Candidatus Omnitrophota bacterium]